MLELMLINFPASAFLLAFVELFGGDKIDGGRIDAVAFFRWFWSIVKNMPHVCTAFGTSYFSSYTVWVFNK